MRSSTESNENASQHEDLISFCMFFALLLAVFPIIFRPFPGWVVSEKRRPFWRLGQKGDLPRFSGGPIFHTGWQPGTTRKMLGRSQEKIKTFINIKHEEPKRILKFHYNSYQKHSKTTVKTISIYYQSGSSWDTVSFFLVFWTPKRKQQQVTLLPMNDASWDPPLLRLGPGGLPLFSGGELTLKGGCFRFTVCDRWSFQRKKRRFLF